MLTLKMALTILTNFINSNPTLSIILIGILVTFVMTLITKKFTDQNRMKELKKIQKACQIKLKEKKGDLEAQKKIQKEIMECSMELMKHSFKPMFITILPLILLIWWLRGAYEETAIAGSWIWWYIGAAIGSSIVLRKILNVV